VHLSEFHTGFFSDTFSASKKSVLINRLALGASTSQSKSLTSSFSDNLPAKYSDKLTARVVFLFRLFR